MDLNNDQELTQELLALLVCLNEQAVKEIGQSEDKHDLEIGQQRLLKAYRMVTDAKS